uniref:hypothetical protein n=1 Tax=uncultured Draconibacterium sp. TaxID=1573823 RepID=UPI003217AE59
MLKRGFLKPNLTINKIGKKQFWVGLIIGFLAAFILNLLFLYAREALRLTTFLSGDAYILSYREFKSYDLFFAALSTSLGFGIAVICWFYVANKKKGKKYQTTFVATTSFFITFLALAIVARFGSLLPLVVYNLQGYDNHLNILSDFGLILILVPVYILFANWNSIRLLFKTKYWMLISVIIFLLNTMFLFKITHFNRNKVNQIHYEKNKDRYEFTDNEIRKAKQLGILISDSTELILQKIYAERTTNLVGQLKEAFKTNGKVSLDTLVLEKIVIHNRNEKQTTWYRTIDSTEQNWSYALPEEVYFQILKHPVNSPETKLLFEILSEQVSIFKTKDIDWMEFHKYSYVEKERYYFKKNILRKTETIQSRLKQVVEALNSNNLYKDYHYLIPDFEFNATRGQKEIILKLPK